MAYCTVIGYAHTCESAHLSACVCSYTTLFPISFPQYRQIIYQIKVLDKKNAMVKPDWKSCFRCGVMLLWTIAIKEPFWSPLASMRSLACNLLETFLFFIAGHTNFISNTHHPLTTIPIINNHPQIISYPNSPPLAPKYSPWSSKYHTHPKTPTPTTPSLTTIINNHPHIIGLPPIPHSNHPNPYPIINNHPHIIPYPNL